MRVAAAVDAISGVRRGGGHGVEVATHYPGGRVVGVSLTSETTVVVHIVAERLPLQDLADEVGTVARAALRSCGDDRAVMVFIDDLDVERLPSRRVGMDRR